MYTYNIVTHYGQIPPSLVDAPQGYRLRDMKFVETSRSASTFGGTSSTETVVGNWVMIWEKYVPDEEQGEQ